MNLHSVNGKNWISKEFNSEEIEFFKTNYFVDEIVAILLSIRKIKLVYSEIMTLMVPHLLQF
jgi:hypothetical protein